MHPEYYINFPLSIQIKYTFTYTHLNHLVVTYFYTGKDLGSELGKTRRNRFNLSTILEYKTKLRHFGAHYRGMNPHNNQDSGGGPVSGRGRNGPLSRDAVAHLRRLLAEYSATTFTSANQQAGSGQGLPQNLPDISHFMGNIERPLSIQYYQTLNLNVAVPLQIQANLVPSNQAIESSVQSMDEGTTQEGNTVPKLAILSAYGPLVKERFQTISHITPNQLKKELTTMEQIREYLYQFAHPAICHNRVHSGRHEAMILHQGQLIEQQQSFLHTLYADLDSNFGLVNQQIAELVANQMAAIQYTERMEQSLRQYVPTITQEVLKSQGLDSNWIRAVTNHVQGNYEVLKALFQELERMCSEQSTPVTSENSLELRIVQNDVLELFEHLKISDKEVKNLSLDVTMIYGDLKSCQQRLDDGLKNIPSASNYAHNKELLKTLMDIANTQGDKIIALTTEVDVLARENFEIRDELRDTRATLHSLQDQIDRLSKQVSNVVPKPLAVHFEEGRPMSRASARSRAESSGNDSFHSLRIQDDDLRGVPRQIMVAENVLENSDNPLLTPEQTRLREREAASEGRFHNSEPNTLNEPRLRTLDSERSSYRRPAYSHVVPNFKPVNLPKFDRKSNVTMFLKLYENTMYGADEAMKNSAIFNCLDTETQTIIMPRLPENGWTFANVSKALVEEFGSEEALNNRKMDFIEGGFKKGESIQEFADRFYLEAQTLASLKAASFVDVKSALLNAVRPNRGLSLALKSGIYGAHNVSELVRHLLTFKDDFEIPFPVASKFSHDRPPRPNVEMPKATSPVAASGSTTSTPSSRTCYRCGKTGHFSRDCKQSKVHHVSMEDQDEQDEKYEEEEDSQSEQSKNC